MRLKRLSFIPFVIAIITNCIFSACNDTGNLGLNLIPDADDGNVNRVDSFSFITKTAFEDTIVTRNAATLMMGYLQDGIFGATGAGFATQVVQTSQNLNLGNNLTLDSIVLSLRVFNVYGDTTQPIEYTVYELDEGLSADSTYTQFSRPKVKPTILAKTIVKLNPRDSIFVNDLTTGQKDSLFKVPSQIRIKLSNELGNRILNASGTADLADNKAFQAFFKGLSIQATELGFGSYGNIYNILINSEFTGLSLYYKSDTNRKIYTFTLRNGAINYNFFHTNPLQSRISTELNVANPLSMEVLTGGAASYQMLATIPWLDSIYNTKKIIINKAEIVFKLSTASQNPLYAPSSSHAIYFKDSTNKITPVVDVLEPWYGGSYDANRKEYRFTLTRHIQSIIDGKLKGNTFALFTSNSVQSANRNRFGAGNHPLYAPKLILTFTKNN